MRTPKINLLPYRDERKKAIQQRFVMFLGASLGAGALCVALVHGYFGMQASTQEERNTALTQDIALLDKEIEEIKKLREQIAAAVARKGVVESLQANRSRAVMILNHVVQPPANIFYRNVKQTGESIALNGFAPSNASVSALIKQIESSDILAEPKLVESKATSLDGALMIEFTINAKIIDLAKLAADQAKAKKEGKAPPPTVAPASPAGSTLIVAPAAQP
jgi:type IV pilus assembly protein PilN